MLDDTRDGLRDDTRHGVRDGGGDAGHRRRWLRGRFVAVAAVVAAVGLAAGLWAFQPWKLLTSSRLDESLPAATAAVPSAASPPAAFPAGSVPPSPAAASPAPAAGPVVLAEGRFVSQEHATSGVARILALPDGSRVLRLEDLASSDGPDLHVWLTDQDPGGADGQYDDGRYLALGKLKATHGNQNYPIPAGADLAGLRSAVIWCNRFNVAFGSAPLAL